MRVKPLLNHFYESIMNAKNYIKKYNDEIEIIFNIDKSIYLNATQTAKKFNKKPDDWLRTKQTKEYIEAILNRFAYSRNEIFIVQQGGKYDEQGT